MSRSSEFTTNRYSCPGSPELAGVLDAPEDPIAMFTFAAPKDWTGIHPGQFGSLLFPRSCSAPRSETRLRRYVKGMLPPLKGRGGATILPGVPRFEANPDSCAPAGGDGHEVPGRNFPAVTRMPVNDAVPDGRPDDRPRHDIRREVSAIVHPSERDAACERVCDRRDRPSVRSRGDDRSDRERFGRMPGRERLALRKWLVLVRVTSLARAQAPRHLLQNRRDDPRGENLGFDRVASDVPELGIPKEESSAERGNRDGDSRIGPAR